jgi:cellulose synthase/poly-beta-1,6-N-acetylglucosamine synthase-like glycosyltransferase
VALAGVVLLLEGLCIGVLGAYVAPSLHVAVFFVAYDLATGAVLLVTASRRLALDRAAATATAGEPAAAAPPLSVLIAAYNEVGDREANGVVATVRGLGLQRGVPFEILVGDDGSQDGTYDAVVRAFALNATDDGHRGSVPRSDGTHATLRVFRFAHAGKGATLNALAARAEHGVLVTMDADTTPAEGALAALAAAFLDERVESAAGVVSVRNARSILTRHQYAEYVKNSIVRIAWSALGALEQVPGAFAGVRAESFRAVGGFPTDSLTEDYELTFRLVDRGRTLGRPPVVVTVPRAQAFTDVPTTLRGFVRQRTRWFAGFLSTLYRFRHLIGRSGAGGFGVVRLPLKVIEAALPLIAFASLVVLVRGVASPVLSLSRVALGIFLVRWLWDLTFYAAALRMARELGSREETSRVAPPLWQGWICTATEALSYVWLKHAAVLRAYGWAARRVRTWEPSREAVMRPTR